jgi:hypothetical protein
MKRTALDRAIDEAQAVLDAEARWGRVNHVSTEAASLIDSILMYATLVKSMAEHPSWHDTSLYTNAVDKIYTLAESLQNEVQP